MPRYFAAAWDWLFPMPATRDLITDQLAEAQREALMHTAAAEHHRALAEMYESRCARLQGMLNTTGATA